jgi:hypothetical protein
VTRMLDPTFEFNKPIYSAYHFRKVSLLSGEDAMESKCMQKLSNLTTQFAACRTHASVWIS